MNRADFEVLKKFVGFGNPNGKYWFIGIEEASGWEIEDKITLEAYGKQIVPVEPRRIQSDETKLTKEGKRFTRIYDYMSYFVLASSGKASDPEACKKYRNEVLLQKHGEEFQANLYPLGKRSVSHWNDDCSRITGCKSRAAYYDEIEKERFTLLCNKWKEYGPTITICFGKSCWDKFEKAFPPERMANPKDFGWYRVYDSRIIFCPFFIGHQMKNTYKEQLAKEVQMLLRKENL